MSARLKTLSLLFSLLVFAVGCSENDEIKELSYKYVNGGIGTTSSTGAIKFTFNIPDYHYTGHVRVIVHTPDRDIERTVSGVGNKEISFSNMIPGAYDYTFEYYYVDKSYDPGVNYQYNFSTGNWSTYYGDVNSIPFLHKNASINKVLEVKVGKTLIFDYDLD
ncbi:hypothetical protein ACQY1Q_15030 [Tenacibaculum sp. TC6]|uniref:hypothetical protein n=1 Tax=Tenacibaculum sp. TC6 TaxID=3423223 RepID=UPI003D3681C8